MLVYGQVFTLRYGKTFFSESLFLTVQIFLEMGHLDSSETCIFGVILVFLFSACELILAYGEILQEVLKAFIIIK